MTSIISTIANLIVTASAYTAHSAYSFKKTHDIPRIPMPTKISDKVYAWCTSKDSVSNELAKDPSLSPGDAVKKLYGEGDGISLSEKKASPHRETATQEELERAFQCGNFGPTRPSELFLRIFHDTLLPLEHDPMMGCVSPSLMGSYGAIPLTVIAPLPDICRHMSNLIARAEKEVFLATNYWMDSDASRLITDALKELSKRAGARGEKAVVKILYDRGNAKQVCNPSFRSNWPRLIFYRSSGTTRRSASRNTPERI